MSRSYSIDYRKCLHEACILLQEMESRHDIRQLRLDFNQCRVAIYQKDEAVQNSLRTNYLTFKKYLRTQKRVKDLSLKLQSQQHSEHDAPSNNHSMPPQSIRSDSEDDDESDSDFSVSNSDVDSSSYSSSSGTSSFLDTTEDDGDDEDGGEFVPFPVLLLFCTTITHPYESRTSTLLCKLPKATELLSAPKVWQYFTLYSISFSSHQRCSIIRRNNFCHVTCSRSTLVNYSVSERCYSML